MHADSETGRKRHMRNGCNGEILRVDLTHSEIRTEEPEEEFYRSYFGGWGPRLGGGYAGSTRQASRPTRALYGTDTEWGAGG